MRSASGGTRRIRGKISRGAVWALVIVVLTAVSVHSQIRLSPDTTLELSGSAVNDEDVAEDNLSGSVTFVDVGPLPGATDVIGYAAEAAHHLLSFDTSIDLPGVAVLPGDVVRFDGSSYTLEFEAAAHGVPRGALTDAVAMTGAGDLLLSFDTTVQLGGVVADDEDLVLFDGASFAPFFDGSSAGVPPELDLDAAEWMANGHLLLSFDGSGMAGTVFFDDEDVLEYDPLLGVWLLAYDGSAHHPTWPVADLDAVAVPAGAVPATETEEPTPEPTATATTTATGTATASPTATPTSTATATHTPKATRTPTATHTPTVTRTPTATPTPPSCVGMGNRNLLGRMAEEGGNQAVAGVTLEMSGPQGCASIETSNPGGHYLFKKLASGTYMVTPSKSGCTFSPPSATVVVSQGTAHQDFSALCP